MSDGGAGRVTHGLPAVERRRLRQIIKRVHPDLFAAHPAERAQNSTSLQVLNGYVAEVSRQHPRPPAELSFYIIEDYGLRRVQANLPAHGSLGQLFLAFGLISTEELDAGAGSVVVGEEDHQNFLHWLSNTVSVAVSAASQHGALRSTIRQLCTALEQQYGFTAVQVGEEFTATSAEQHRQLEALEAFETFLAHCQSEDRQFLSGLQVRLYHPDVACLDMADAQGTHAASMQSFVGEDGRLHLVGDAESLAAAMQELDLNQAHVLSRLDTFWSQRCRGLAQELVGLLGVETVWYDPSSAQASQEFVLWAGSILEHRDDLIAALHSRKFHFSILMHQDGSAPAIEYIAGARILQVYASCAWDQLRDHLLSSHASHADAAAAALDEGRSTQAAALQQARHALGAAQVISVCSEADRGHVIDAARRLCTHAPAISAAIDLAGISLAIDDCFEVWESGFISIPYNFRVEELQPQLMGLLSAPPAGDSTAGAAGDMHGVPPSNDEADDARSNSTSAELSSSSWPTHGHSDPGMTAHEQLTCRCLGSAAAQPLSRHVKGAGSMAQCTRGFNFAHFSRPIFRANLAARQRLMLCRRAPAMRCLHKL